MAAFGLICYVLGAILAAGVVEMIAGDAHRLTKMAMIFSWPLIMAYVVVTVFIDDRRRG